MDLNFSSQKLSLALAATGSSVLSMVSVGFAQVPFQTPNQLIEPVPEVERRVPTERPSETPPTIEIPVLPRPTVPEILLNDSTIIVETFQFVGNSVISDEALSEVAQPYLNRPLDAADLLKLRQLLTNLYISEGYFYSALSLSINENQIVDPTKATVTYEVVEGSVEQLDVVGDRRLSDYVSRRLDHALYPINQPKLAEAIQLLQADPLIRSITGNISPGSKPGLNVLEINLVAEPIFEFRVGSDNRRLPSVGTIQTQTTLSASNLLSAGEIISAGYGRSEGSDRFNMRFAAPVNAGNGTLSFQYTSIDGRIVEDPLSEFDIETNSQLYALTFEQPILRKATTTTVEELTVGLGAARVNSQATLFDQPFPLSPGADNSGSTRIFELSIFQNYTKRNRDSVLFTSTEFDIGLNAFDATVGDEPDAQYVTWKSRAFWLQQLANIGQLSVEGNIQLSGDRLIPFSQFFIGGPGSIRGYRQDALLADSGATLNAEFLLPIANNGRQQLSLIPFGGVGVGWNNGSERALGTNVLASVGIGAQLDWDDFAARVNYAVPFTSIEGAGNSLQEQGIDFELLYRLRF